jgi:hypothetical protein
MSKVSKGIKGIILLVLTRPRATSGWLFVRERVGKYLAREGITSYDKGRCECEKFVKEGNV